MSVSRGRNASGSSGPTIEDCNRLWTTIIKEYITDAEITLTLQVYPLGSKRPNLCVCSPGFHPETGAPYMHTWATTELRASSLAFTYSQLYDLLIVAYRKIEGHLGGQSELELP